MSEQPKVIPDIPRGFFPGEKREIKTPRHELESAWSQPYLALAADIATASGDRAKQLIRGVAANLMAHPEDLKTFYGALDILEAVGQSDKADENTEKTKKEGPYNVAESKRLLQKELVAQATKEFPPKTTALEAWLELFFEESEFKPLAEAVMKKFFDKCSSPELTINFLHPLTEALVSLQTQASLHFLLDLLSFQTPFITPRSAMARWFILQMYSSSDDQFLKQYEIQQIFRQIALQNDPEKNATLVKYNNEIVQTPEYRKEVSELYKKEPFRLTELEDYHTRDDRALKPGMQDKFPYNLILKNDSYLGRLSRYMFEYRYNKENGILGGTFTEPKTGMSALMKFESVSDAIDFIKTAYQKKPDTEADLLSPGHLETIGNLAPIEFFKETFDREAFSNITQQLRRDLTGATPRLLSPRGDKVKITDEKLRALGYDYIEFHINPAHKRETLVRLKVGNFTLAYKLTDQMVIKPILESDRIVPYGAQNFLDHITLSHLHGVRCSEVITETDRGFVDEHHGPLVGGRCPHRRFLPAGKKPTPTQIQYIFDRYEISIPQLNHELAEKGETRLVTYVAEVDPKEDISNLPPLNLKTPKALDEFNRLLAKEKA